MKLNKNASSRHTRGFELKVEQLTLLDNGILTENICTFDEQIVKKELTSYALLQAIQELQTEVRELTFSRQSNFSQRNTLNLISKITLKRTLCRMILQSISDLKATE